MKIPFSRRQRSNSIGSSGAPFLGAESDAELARLATQRNAVLARAEQDVSRILYAGPPVR
jgi:hypothetical protein